MTTLQKDRFLEIWSTYFPGAELPLVFFRSDEMHGASPGRPAKGWRCFIGDLAAVRGGEPIAFARDTVGCGRRYLGFDSRQRKDFAHFLSCGIPGRLEGERYKQSPELVEAWQKTVPVVPPTKRYVVFKRWDALDDGDKPEVVVFFAIPDVLSGLFTWSGFDEPVAEAVAAPFGAGCASIVQYPLLEAAKERPRAIIGMFDVSARPRVPEDVLTFAVPWVKFERMLATADETFLTTDEWAKVRKRIARRTGARR
jgi:Uncharacterised ArCR, COG2043